MNFASCFKLKNFSKKTKTLPLLPSWNSMLRIITSIRLIIFTGVTQKYGMEYLEAMLQLWKVQWGSTCLIYLRNNRIYLMNWYVVTVYTFLIAFSCWQVLLNIGCFNATLLFPCRHECNEILVDAKCIFYECSLLGMLNVYFMAFWNVWSVTGVSLSVKGVACWSV